MPIRVPRSQGGQVQSTQMPRARVNTSAPSGAFGDPVGQVAAKGIEQLAGGAQALIEEKIKVQTERARKAKLLNFDNQAAELEQGLQREALSRKGINAFGVHEEIDKKWSEFSEAQLQSFSDPDLRLAAEQVLSRRKVSLSKVVEAHAQKESDNVFVGELSAGIENNIKLASLNFTDPQEIAKNLNDAEDKAVELSAFYGHDKEQREQFILKATSPIHESVIEAKMRSGDISGAKQYLLENELGLDTKTRESLASVVDKAHDAFIADKFSTAGIQKYAIAVDQTQRLRATLADLKKKDDVESYKKAANIRVELEQFEKDAMRPRQMFQAMLDSKETDPDIKKAAMSRFDDRMALYEKDKKDNRSRVFDLATEVYKTQGIGSLLGPQRILWEAVHPQDRAILMNSHDREVKGVDRETPVADRLEFLSLPPQALAALPAFEVERRVKNFSNAHREDALKRWANAKSGNADTKYLTPLSKYQKVVDLAYQAKFNKKLDPKTQNGAEIILGIQNAVEQHEIKNGRAATETDIRKLVQQEFSDRVLVTQPGRFFGIFGDRETEKMKATVQPGDKYRIPIDKIPDNMQTRTRNFMRNKGVAPAYLSNEKTISEVYTLTQSGDIEGLERLIKMLRGGKPLEANRTLESDQSKPAYQRDRDLKNIRTVP